jgi:GMP synthase-like glutamine amidotransferase
MNAQILQHVPFEGPGSIGRWLEDEGAEISITRLYAGELPPPPEGLDLVVIMGGPMSVNDEAIHRWLGDEKRFVRDVIDHGSSVLGVCLGAQVVASALGARVYANPEKEIGWFPVNGLHPPGESFRLPLHQTVFHWHGETFELPPGAVRIAANDCCANQGFQIGRRIVGLQFHLEATPAGVWDLVQNVRHELQPAGHIQSEDTILNPPFQYFDDMHAVMDSLLEYLMSAP